MGIFSEGVDDLVAELEEVKRERDSLRARLEHFEGMFVPGTKLLVPCVASVPDPKHCPPGMREVETRHGVILRIFPNDAILDERLTKAAG